MNGKWIPLILTTGLLVSCVNMDECLNPELIRIDNPDLNDTEDGVYKGKYIAGPVKVLAEVEIADHQYRSIKIIRHRNGQGKAAETIVDRVIADQSLNVDCVSGATVSSKVILKAIEVSLSQ